VVDRERQKRADELSMLQRRWKDRESGGMDAADESADERSERHRAVTSVIEASGDARVSKLYTVTYCRYICHWMDLTLK